MEKATRFLKKYALPAFFIAAVLLLDQLVKNWAVATLPGNRITVIEDVFYLTFATNSGAAWNILSGSRGILLLVSLAAFGLIFYIFKAGWITTAFGRWTMYAVIGGALGNFIDRVFDPNGYVIDMFDFRLINFGIFNVADVFIVAGTILTVIYVLFLHDKAAQNEEKSHDADSQSNN